MHVLVCLFAMFWELGLYSLTRLILNFMASHLIGLEREWICLGQSNVLSLNLELEVGVVHRRWWFNPFPNKLLLLCVCNTCLSKTLGKGEIACNGQFLLFPPAFSTPYGELSAIYMKIRLSSANSFSLCKVQNLFAWERVNASRRLNCP